VSNILRFLRGALASIRRSGAFQPPAPFRPIATLLLLLLALALPLSTLAQTKRPSSKTSANASVHALFDESNLEAARTFAGSALKQNPRDLDAFFVEMEASALEADTPAVLDAALRLLELKTAQTDDRVAIAAARIHDLAANTQEFRDVLPRIEAVLARPHVQAHTLQAALVKAAMDGVAEVKIEQVTRQAGILTDWRVAGPFGEYPDLDFPRAWPPQHDQLMGSASDGHRVELLRFDDGQFHLPEYFGKSGVFYAMAEANSVSGEFVVRAGNSGTLEVFVDGESVLRQDSRFRVTAATAEHTVRLKAGTHTVLVKFLPAALPFRISIDRVVNAPASAKNRPASVPGSEAEYVAAAREYWSGNASGAIAAI